MSMFQIFQNKAVTLFKIICTNCKKILNNTFKFSCSYSYYITGQYKVIIFANQLLKKCLSL